MSHSWDFSIGWRKCLPGSLQRWFFLWLKNRHVAWEPAQWLGELAALPKNLNLILSTYAKWLTTSLCLALGHQTASSGVHAHPDMSLTYSCAYTHSHPTELLYQHMLEIPQQVWGLFSLHRFTSSQSYIADPKQTPHKVSPIIVYNPRIHPIALWLLRCVVFIRVFVHILICLFVVGSLHSPGFPWIHYMGQASLKLKEICLPPPPKYWD